MKAFNVEREAQIMPRLISKILEDSKLSPQTIEIKHKGGRKRSLYPEMLTLNSHIKKYSSFGLKYVHCARKIRRSKLAKVTLFQ